MNSSQTQASVKVESLSVLNRKALYLYLAAQAFFLLYLAYTLPVHYDEWYSYRHFSSAPLATTISFYPGTNNHVFYNLIAHFFVWPHSLVSFFMRLPSVIAAILTIWYLYKLCKNYTSNFSAWLVVLAYSTSYNVILYAVEARGYAFVNLFTVLAIEQAVQFCAKAPGIKNYLKFAVVQALGLFTVPTFIYALVPIYLFLSFYFLISAQYNRLFSVALLAGLSILVSTILYGPIILSGGLETLLHTTSTEGKFSFSDAGAIDSIIYFLNKMYFEVLSLSHPLYTGIALLLLLVAAKVAKLKSLKLFCLAYIFLICPFFIHLVHHFFAYGRNWFFLLVPASILVALPLELISKGVALVWYQRKQVQYWSALVVALVVMLAVWRAFQFAPIHKREYSLDYALQRLEKTQAHVSSIGRTDGNFEFYPAEVLQSHYQNCDTKKEVPVSIIAGTPHDDLLIVAAEKVAAQKIDRKRYKFCFYSHNLFYYRKINGLNN